MKKKLLLGLCMSAAVMGLAGCNKDEKKEEPKPEEKKEEKVETKNLNCSVTQDEGETVKYTLNYTGDKFTKATFSVSSKLKDEAAAKKEYESRKKDIEEYNKSKGVSANASISNTLVSSSVTFTIENLDDKGKELYDESGLKELDGKSYDDAKSTLETAGWACK